MKTIYITRHGTRQDHLTGTPTPSKSGYVYDPPLAEEGLAQSQHLANYLKENARINYIFSSPFYRTLQTATIVADTLNLKIIVESGLMDWYGGSPNYATFIPKPAPFNKLIEFFPDIDESYHSHVKIATIAEPKEEMYERIGKTVQILLDTFSSKDSNEDQEFLFVCHAASAIMVNYHILILIILQYYI